MQRSYPSRLSRNELYSYGFKEGQPWAEDRRSLEAALHAMERLELDIQQNYIDRRASPYSHNYPAAPGPAVAASAPSPSRHYLGGVNEYYPYAPPPQYPTPDHRIARSNNSGSSSDSPQLSREWSSGGGRGYGSPDRRDNTRSGWQSRGQAQESPTYHRSSGWAERSYASQPQQQQRYAAPAVANSPPSHRSSKSTYRGRQDYTGYHDARPQSQRYQEQPQYSQYGPPASPSRISSRHSVDSRAPPMSPSQWQVSRVVDGRGDRYDDEGDFDGEHQQYYDHHGSSSIGSPDWSTGAARDDASDDRQLSVASSPGMYSQGSFDSEYTRSSGYVESFEVSSRYEDEHPGYGEFREEDEFYHSGEDEHDYGEHHPPHDEGLYQVDEVAEFLYGGEEDPEEYHSDPHGGYSDEGHSDGGYSGGGNSDGGYSDDYDDGSYDDDYDD